MASNCDLAGNYKILTNSTEYSVDTIDTSKEISFKTNGVKRCRIEDDDFRTEAFSPGLTETTIAGTTYTMSPGTDLGTLIIRAASTAGEVKLPALVGLNNGRVFKIVNENSGTDTFPIKSNVLSILLCEIAPGESAIFTVNDNSDNTAGWSVEVSGSKVVVNVPAYSVDVTVQNYLGPAPLGTYSSCTLSPGALSETWYMKCFKTTTSGNIPIYKIHVSFTFEIATVPANTGTPGRISLPAQISFNDVVPIHFQYDTGVIVDRPITGLLQPGTSYIEFPNEDFTGASTVIQGYFEYLSDVEPV